MNGEGNGSMSNRIYNVPDGMPLSVFHDRYARAVDNGFQSYTDRVTEMVIGNTLLGEVTGEERESFIKHAISGLLPMSGRHLQHGDDTQPNRNIEVFTNCSTAAFSFLNFYLLLNGSGVGRDYSTESCRVDWDYMPNVRLVLDGGINDSGAVSDGAHPDFASAMNEFSSCFDSLREANHKYDSESEDVRWIKVRDSREGWAEVVAVLETTSFHRNHKDSLFIFDFSGVRGKNSPIKGMQNRPAQGPLPLMRAIAKVCTIKGTKMKPWKQAMFIDHILASCVVMGNVRRAARMATKWWKDRDVIEFIDIKRGGFFWTANNSILVDTEFWELAKNPHPSHARRVFEAATGAAYYDKTGEPGFINVDQLNQNKEGFESITAATYLNGTHDLHVHPKTYSMMDNVLTVLKASKYPFIVNPCSEIVLAKFGAYCVIGDVAMNHATSFEEVEEAVSLAARALVRTNLMPALYQSEVDRTNRIGVGITGIFEYAWKMHKLSFHDIIDAYPYVFENDPTPPKSLPFWQDLVKLREAVTKSATEYSIQLGRKVPHTFTTIKPSGTISKIMSCTEGAHLPPYAFYVRWVIVEKDSARHREYIEHGYPIKDVSHQYTNCVVVGFPTKHPITDLIPIEHLVTASDVTPEEQYKWLLLLDYFWIGPNNNQISYTMKYDNAKINYNKFMQLILEWQSKVKCCAVMPFTDSSAYAYLPEEKINKTTYDQMMSQINRLQEEDYDESSVLCEGGACPVEQLIR